jgi:flavorubredoxin
MTSSGWNAGLLPRELAPNVFWLGECLPMPYRDTLLHSYGSLYLVRGSEASLLVEAGLPVHSDVTETQLATLLQSGPPLRYVFLTHQETPHAGGVGRLLEQYPDAIAVGDVRDYHLFFPTLADRFQSLVPGDTLDLGGGTSFRVTSAVIRDLITTQWGFAPSQRVLFPSDGFAFAHYHRAGQCGKTAEETSELEIADMGGLFIEQALPWMCYTDLEPYVDRLEAMIAELAVDIVAPSHGLPITDLGATMPQIVEGIRMAGRMNTPTDVTKSAEPS